MIELFDTRNIIYHSTANCRLTKLYCRVNLVDILDCPMPSFEVIV